MRFFSGNRFFPKWVSWNIQLSSYTFRKKWKNMKDFFVFTHIFRKYWWFNFQVLRFNLTNFEIAENCGFFHIFQTYRQESCRFPGSYSYSVRILQSKLVFSLSTTSYFLLGLEQVPYRTHTSPEQVPFENHRSQTSPIQDPNRFRLKSSKTRIKVVLRSSSFLFWWNTREWETKNKTKQDKTRQSEKL